MRVLISKKECRLQSRLRPDIPDNAFFSLEFLPADRPF